MRTQCGETSFGSAVAPASSPVVSTTMTRVPPPVRPTNALSSMPSPKTASAQDSPIWRLVPTGWPCHARPVPRPAATSASRKTRPPMPRGPRLAAAGAAVQGDWRDGGGSAAESEGPQR